MRCLWIITGSRLTVIGLMVLVITGCAYQGDDITPLERKLSWYSYLNADDLRDRCTQGQGDALRLVYNAIHTEQIRTYDISVPNHHSNSLQKPNAQMKVRVLGPAYLSKIGLDDMLAPWRGNKETIHLRPGDIDRLWDAMEISGAFEPATEERHLVSEQFFWLTAICRAGVFQYNAYAWPSDKFSNIQFDKILFAWDMTEVPVNLPRKVTMFEIYGESVPRHKTGAYYQVTIDRNGLKNY